MAHHQNLGDLTSKFNFTSQTVQMVQISWQYIKAETKMLCIYFLECFLKKSACSFSKSKEEKI
jgi:hypothetical protein